MKRKPTIWTSMAAFLVLVVLLTGCGLNDDSETAEELDTDTNPSPEAQANVPEGVEGVTITIENGEIEEGSVNLQEGQPTMLLVENLDSTAYSLQIVPNLVLATDIAASDTTQVSFTTPVVDEYTLELRLADGSGDPLDTVQVEVQSPSGVT